MIGYVAKDDDNSIWFHCDYPTKEGRYYISENMFMLPYNEYPEFQSITEPIKVNLTIKIIQND